MRIDEVSPSEYGAVFGQTPHIFNSVEFSELNRSKVTALHYLAFKDTKTRFGLILGERKDGLYSPFSAPFGGFSSNETQRLDKMEEAIALLKEHRDAGGRLPFKPINIVLPPLVYGETQLTKWANVLHRHGTLSHIELNYHFSLPAFGNYEAAIGRNARKNLNRAMQEDFAFLVLDGTNDSDIERAYNMIKANREEHGYPLRMTLQAVKDTSKILQADFFVMTYGGKDVAAAQVFHVAEGVAQVIYWGDLHACSHLRTMNRLAYELFRHYHAQGLKTLDIGPSTEDGAPNYGLCDFKESIGCSVSPKFGFIV